MLIAGILGMETGVVIHTYNFVVRTRPYEKVRPHKNLLRMGKHWGSTDIESPGKSVHQGVV
jgi:hypothetical protein